MSKSLETFLCQNNLILLHYVIKDSSGFPWISGKVKNRLGIFQMHFTSRDIEITDFIKSPALTGLTSQQKNKILLQK